MSFLDPVHFLMPDLQSSPLTPTGPPSPTLPPIPKLGQTRCYWALLSAELDFLYIDPVLHAHLGPQADTIIGKKLLDFVHPDEHASANQDLGKVLESRTLHGSVTRVRYSRLGRVRARLGYTGVHNKFADEDKVSFDEDYMACDLVINWASEGLVLCFIHAVVDMSPQDNDEHHRTHWTNWCGTPRMNGSHGADLYHALFHIAPHAAQGAPPPTRVFQILHNSTDRPTLFSWPGEGYIPADYGRLANDVQIGGANGSDAKTSCTRRYKAQQVLNSADGSVRDVESIYIPHGHIIFACHKATLHRPPGHPNSYPIYPTPAQFYETATHTPYYPPVHLPTQIEPYPGPAAYGYHGPSPGASRSAGTHSPYQAAQWSSSGSGQHHPPPYLDDHPPNGNRSATEFIDEVPPARQRGWPSADLGGDPTPETYQGGGRSGGNPPAGVSRCSACKSTSSPEWRKGPSGRKDLCNACGLRYSRARAKKEGLAVQRRRKEGKAAAQGHAGKRRGHANNGYGDFGLDEQQQPVGGAGGDGSTSPSPPHEYRPPVHPPSSGMYPAYPGPVVPRGGGTMYIGPSQQAYAAQQHNGFLGATPSPGPEVPHASPATRSTTLSASSYERTGMVAETRSAVGNRHGHVPP